MMKRFVQSDWLTPSAPLALLAVVVYAFVYAYCKALSRYDCVVLPVLLVGLFAALERVGARARFWLLFASTELLVGAFLLHLWTLGYEGRNAVFGGVLPWSDSRDFLTGALRLVHGARLSEAASRRPLFPSLLAVLLRLTQGDLRASLALLALAGGAGVTVAAIEVFRTDGWRSSLVVYGVLLLLERRFAGFIQSEHLGLIAGTLGFAALWRASASPPDERTRRWLALSGLFALSFGLMARAGPLFVLPALGAWYILEHRNRAARATVEAALALGAGAAIHSIVLRAVGSGASFSDYPAIAYGLIHGEDFTYLAERHPEVRSLPLDLRMSAALHLVAGDLVAHPLSATGNIALAWVEFFISPYGLFSYVWTNPDDRIFENGPLMRELVHTRGALGPILYWRETLGTLSIVNTLCMALLGVAFIVGFVAALTRIARSLTRRAAPVDDCAFRGERLPLLTAVALGILTSAPFTPPWITSGVQVQTVTLAFAAVLPALLVRRAPRRAPLAPLSSPLLTVALPAVALALLALLTWVRLAPDLVPSLERPGAEGLCEGASATRAVRLYVGLRVLVTRERRFAFSPKAEADLRASLTFLRRHFGDLAGALEAELRPGAAYVSAYDPCRQEAVILLDPARITDAHPAGWQVLGLADTGVPGVHLVLAPAASAR